MKKFSILFFMLTLMGTSLLAQRNYDYAIGLRAGNPAGVTGKIFFSEHSAAEIISGLEFNRGFTLTGLYEYHFYLTEGAAWFGGAGLSVGAQEAGVSFGIDAIIGVEFTLYNIPINFGIDWKPAYVFGIQNRTDGLLDFALSLRYAFR